MIHTYGSIAIHSPHLPRWNTDNEQNGNIYLKQCILKLLASIQTKTVHVKDKIRRIKKKQKQILYMSRTKLKIDMTENIVRNLIAIKTIPLTLGYKYSTTLIPTIALSILLYTP